MKEPIKGIIGVRVDKFGNPCPPKNEIDNFHKCSVCGQMVDRRDLGEVFHHLKPEHEPIGSDA